MSKFIARCCWRLCERFPHTRMPMWILKRAGDYQSWLWGMP